MTRKNKDFYGVTVGRTSNGSVVSIPYDLKILEKYMVQLDFIYNWFEIFEIHAIFEYMSIREKSRYSENSLHLEIFQSISIRTRYLLISINQFDEAMKKYGIKNSIDVLKLGESLVLSEFKGI